MDLANRRALVTGGTSGIGKAICLAFVEAGARVLACGSDPQRVTDLEAAGLGFSTFCCDVTEQEDVRAAADAVDARLGGLDVLVNCAGVQRSIDHVAGVDMHDVEHEVAVNLIGPIRVTDAMLPRLLTSDDAAIVNVTSVLALAPKQSAPIYCAAKAGLASWTTALRQRLEEHHVHVMELVPPIVDTRMTEGRNQGAIAPEVVARACVKGLQASSPRVAVGKARVASILHRVSPALLQRKLRHS